MILITKTSDQTRQRGHALSTCTICMYVCIYVYMVTTYSKSMDQSGKVANPARGQLKRVNSYFSIPVRA